MTLPKRPIGAFSEEEVGTISRNYLLVVSTQPRQTVLMRMLLCKARISTAAQVIGPSAAIAVKSGTILTGQLHDTNNSMLSRRIGYHARCTKIRLCRA